MNDLTNQVILNRAFNQIMDIAEKEGVALEVFGNAPGPAALLIKDGDKVVDRLLFNHAKRTTAYDESKPPIDFDAFVNIATDTFVRKNTDYGNRYTKALIEEGPVIWRWEVDKKVDRIRSWVERGELLVKGEGVNNSVQDLFNYSVLYELYAIAEAAEIDPYSLLTESHFYGMAISGTPYSFIAHLEREGRIAPEEAEVKAIILKYMGVTND